MNHLFVLHENSPNLGVYDLKTRSQLGSFSTGYNSYRFDISTANLPYIQVNPLSGTIQGGKADTVTFIIYSEYLLHKIYKTNIVIRSNDIDNPFLKIPITINSQDIKPPEFNMAFFINPYLTNDLKVIVFAHEYLMEPPELSVGASDKLSLALHDSAYYIYMAKYKLTTSEDITFTVTGADSLGNVSTFQRTLRVTNVPLGKAILLSNLGGEISIKLASESFDQERFVIVWDEQQDEVVNKIYHVGPNFLPLKYSATIEIDYSKLNRSIDAPQHLSFYQKNINDQWEKIPSRLDKARKIMMAEIIQLGVFKVGYDESNFTEEFVSIPTEFRLHQNYPNPFNPNTTICYAIPTQQHVTLKVYNVLGREVAILVDKLQEPGNYKIIFSSENLVSGIYFYRLEAGKYNETRKMILMR